MTTRDEKESGMRASHLLTQSGTQGSPRWLTTAEFSRLYRVSQWSARRWAKQGRVRAMRVPPRKGGRMAILDPQWNLLDVPLFGDPAEWLAVFWQCEVAALVGVTARPVRP
jgi:hypothetical protein